MNPWLVAFLIWLLVSFVLASIWLALSFVKGRKAEKVLKAFYSGSKSLAELSYSEYLEVAKAGWLLRKTDRDLEQEKAIYKSPCHRSVRFIIADPPEPSKGDGDKWCARCRKACNCFVFRSGGFCDGVSFVPVDHVSQGQVSKEAKQ